VHRWHKNNNDTSSITDHTTLQYYYTTSYYYTTILHYYTRVRIAHKYNASTEVVYDFYFYPLYMIGESSKSARVIIMNVPQGIKLHELVDALKNTGEM